MLGAFVKSVLQDANRRRGGNVENKGGPIGDRHPGTTRTGFVSNRCRSSFPRRVYRGNFFIRPIPLGVYVQLRLSPRGSHAIPSV